MDNWFQIVALIVSIIALLIVTWYRGYNKALEDIARNVVSRLPLTEKDAKEREGKDA